MSEIPNPGDRDRELEAKAAAEYQALIRARVAAINLYTTEMLLEIFDEYSGFVRDATVDKSDAVAVYDSYKSKYEAEAEAEKTAQKEIAYRIVRDRHGVDFDRGDEPEYIDENDPRYDS